MGIISEIEMRQATEAFWREKIAIDIQGWAEDFIDNSVNQTVVLICASVARGHTKPQNTVLTHDALLEFVDVNAPVNPKPLIAVLNLHSPSDWGNCLACSGDTNETLVAYPCPTVEAIKFNLQ